MSGRKKRVEKKKKGFTNKITNNLKKVHDQFHTLILTETVLELSIVSTPELRGKLFLKKSITWICSRGTCTIMKKVKVSM